MIKDYIESGRGYQEVLKEAEHSNSITGETGSISNTFEADMNNALRTVVFRLLTKTNY